MSNNNTISNVIAIVINNSNVISRLIWHSELHNQTSIFG